MSEPVHVAEGVSHVQARAGAEVSKAEFDQAEIKSFGHDDRHAVTVIGKMLVGFFFYSLVIMAAVAWLTFRDVGQPAAHAAAAHHSDEADDF